MDENSQVKSARQCLHDCAGDLMVAMLSATVMTEQLKSENHPAAKDAQSLLDFLRKTSLSLTALREALDGEQKPTEKSESGGGCASPG